MRAQEFLTEMMLDIPDQMITVQIPLASVTNGSSPTINPGKRAGEAGEYKWSPPLQQHLDTAKDAVGHSNLELNTSDAEEAEELKHETDSVDDLRRRIAAILAKAPSILE